MRGATRWGILGLSTLFFNNEHFNFMVSSFFSYSSNIYIIYFYYIHIFLESPSNYIFVFQISADKNFTAPNFEFISEPDLTRIFQSKIFLHTNRQLCTAHVILGYKPISSSFQSPKYVIKAKDLQLQQINIAVPGFLTSPPPKGTHQVELPTQSVIKEEATFSHSALEEETIRAIDVLDSKEDFEVFD